MNARFRKSPAMVAAASAILLVSSAAFASSGDKLFERLDRDRDGFVSRVEARSEPMLAEGFEVADENHDGKLAPDEFLKARSVYDRAKLAAYSRDAYITAKVKATLLKDHTVSGLDIHVTTRQGVVYLSGAVGSYAEAQRARQLAAGIDDVSEVIDQIIVSRG